MYKLNNILRKTISEHFCEEKKAEIAICMKVEKNNRNVAEKSLSELNRSLQNTQKSYKMFHFFYACKMPLVWDTKMHSYFLS